jgi:predicted dehydrogenase
MSNRARVALIGAGKRARNFYGPLLTKMKDEFELIGVTSRTSESRESFATDFNIEAFSSIEELRDKELDFAICCVNPESVFDIVNRVSEMGIPVTIETPILDDRIIPLVNNSGASVSVVEQWPLLPLEQFKRKIIDSNVLGKIIFVENDCRLFDYHAIATLRRYLPKDSAPHSIFGLNYSSNIPIGSDQFFENWDVGVVKFSNGEILSHKFSYPCKKFGHRGIQSVRIIGENGCLISSARDNLNDDFENIELSFNSDEIRTFKVDFDRDKESSTTRWIKCDLPDGEIMWKNEINERYKSDFNDQMTAIATHLVNMKKQTCDSFFFESPYSVFDAFLDTLVINGIKHSARTGSPVQFK